MSHRILIGITLVAIIVVGYLWLTQRNPDKYTGLVEKVRFGHQLTISSGLTIIADKQGYFEEEGLDIEGHNYVSGKRAFQEGLIPGVVDAIASQEAPVVFNSFNSDDFMIITMINSGPSDKIIIARKDSGISSGKDLKGKRVATQEGSAVHFYLHVFLLYQGLSDEDIELSFMKGEKLPEALANGEIDAFSMREPFVSQAVNLIGKDNVVLFEDKDIYHALDVVVASRTLIDEKPEAITKLIRALLKAETFMRDNPDKTKDILRQIIGADKSELDRIWPHFNFKVTLGQALISSLEEEARWAIRNGLVDATEIPNYLDYIYIDALETVHPEAVTMIR